MIEYIEHYKSSMGTRIYYVGQQIGKSTVAKIKNTSMPYPDEQSARLLDSEGNLIKEVYGGTITEKHDRKNLAKALGHEIDYINDMVTMGKHIRFGTGNVNDACFKQSPKPEGWKNYKERMCIG